MATEIEKIMEKKGTPTLKALAAVFDLPAARLYSVARQPIPGEVYDTKVTNWEAIERFVKRRLDPDKGLKTLEDVIATAMTKQAELKETDGRRGRGVTVEMIEVDGKNIPKRKYPNFEMSAKKHICLKKDPAVYKILYQTLSHTVMQAVKKDGTPATQAVKVISNSMLNLKGLNEAQLEKGMQDRFNQAGEFKPISAEGKNPPPEEAKSK